MHTQPMPLASDIMTTNVQKIGPKMELAEIIAFLLEHKRTSAPVVDDKNGSPRLLGFVSERDCLEHLGNELFYGNPSPPQTAETIMRRHPTCVGPDTDLFPLTSIFTSHGFRHLPVVEDETLIGIVSRRDVLKGIDAYYRERIRKGNSERLPVDIHQIMNHRFIMRSR